MKCPKCGYNSFDHLEDCTKCGSDLSDHKGKFGIRSLLFARKESSPPATVTEDGLSSAPEASPPEGADFGFDFMSGEEPPAAPEESTLDGLLGGDEGEDGIPAQPAPSDDFHDIAERFPVESPGGEAETEPFSAFEDPAGETGDEQLSFDASDKETEADFSWEETPPVGSDGASSVSGAAPPVLGKQLSEGRNEEPSPGEYPEGEGEGWESPGDGVKKSRSVPDERRSSPDDEDASADLASLFLGSLGEEADDPHDRKDPGEEAESLPALDSGFETSPHDPFPTPLEFGTPDPISAADFTLDVQPVEEERGDAAALPENPVEPERDHFAGRDDFPDFPARPSVFARIGAGMADLLILLLMFALFLTAGELALSPGEKSGWLPSAAMLAELAIPYFLVLFALSFGYFTLFHFLAGQTPGKMLFGLRVEGEEGSSLLLSQAFLRSVGGLLSLLPAGLGYLRILFDPQHRGWNDRLAGSRVVSAHPGSDQVIDD